MMFPELKKIPYKQEQDIIDFKGYNRLPTREDGEMIDMLNLTSDHYPYLSTRHKRGVFKEVGGIEYIGSHGEHFFYVKGTSFYFDDKLKGDVTAGEKHIAVMNDYVVIFPDKKIYDITNDKWEEMQKSVVIEEAIIKEESITANSGENLDKVFAVGDAIKIEGATDEHNNRTLVIKEFSSSNVIEVGANVLRPESRVRLTLTREVPDLQFVVEYENRLWGCKGNEIYASKQGSCVNFNVFQGLNNDSYATDVGTPGPFTALINYNNNLIFFKENVLHKLYGNKPKNYQIITHHTQGVQAGQHKSVTIANNILFYKTANYIMAYNGAVPEIVSHKFGLDRYDEAIAGSDGNKVYYCLKRDNQYELFVLDTHKNIWHKEDNLKVIDFEFHKGELVMNVGNKLLKTIGKDEGDFEFMAELGPFFEKNKDKKTYSKLNLEIELGDRSICNIKIKHDEKEYKQVATLTGLKKHHILPIQPKRSHCFTILLEGKGECQIQSINRTFRTKGDK